MNKTELIEVVAAKTALKKKDADVAVAAVFVPANFGQNIGSIKIKSLAVALAILEPHKT